MNLHKFRFHFLFALLLLSLLLAACSNSSDNIAEAQVATTVPEAPAVVPTVAAQVEPTPVPVESTALPDATPSFNEAASSSDASTDAATDAATDDVQAAKKLFQIDATQSEARFTVDELLFGDPNTVVGRTSEVTGKIEIDLADPTQTTIGLIQINARSLATDNRFRNRSLTRRILEANKDEYQYITFTPTAIEGLPESASVGDSISMQVTGDLQIRDIVQPVTFAVTVTADSETQLTGLAQTVVQRADFGLEIPSVDGVADVTEEVQLELEFVAIASE
jgi:polyisoprenoid-binding protein YceI